MFDFSPVLSGARSSQELAANLTGEDLANLTEEMCDLQLQAIRDTVEESRRMRLGMLAAWPGEPHLDNFYTPYQGRPPMNALGRFLSGLVHDASHLDQMRKIMIQARSRRAAA